MNDNNLIINNIINLPYYLKVKPKLVPELILKTFETQLMMQFDSKITPNFCIFWFMFREFFFGIGGQTNTDTANKPAKRSRRLEGNAFIGQ